MLCRVPYVCSVVTVLITAGTRGDWRRNEPTKRERTKSRARGQTLPTEAQQLTNFVPSTDMPPVMRGSPSTSIENGNRLGARPVVRQSKFYREGNSGNAVKDLLGQANLAWDMENQEGAFKGQAIYDGREQGYRGTGQAPPAFQQQQNHYGPPPAPHLFGPPQQQPPLQQHFQQQRKNVNFPQGMMAPTRGSGPFQLPGQQGGGSAAGAAMPFQPGTTGDAGGPVETAEYPLPGSISACDGCGEVVNRYYHCLDCREDVQLFDLCVRCCGTMYLQGGPKLPHPMHDYTSHRMTHVAP